MECSLFSDAASLPHVTTTIAAAHRRYGGSRGGREVCSTPEPITVLLIWVDAVLFGVLSVLVLRTLELLNISWSTVIVCCMMLCSFVLFIVQSIVLSFCCCRLLYCYL